MMSAVVVGRKLVSNFNLGCRMCIANVNYLRGNWSNIAKNNVHKGLATSARGVQLLPQQCSLSKSVSSGTTCVAPKQLTAIVRDFSRSSVRTINWFTPRDDTTLWGRTLKKLGFTEIPKSILMASGYLMYMKVADELDYLKFFKTCNLPDTFASWFTVVELHVWLLSTRLMQDGKEGRLVRNSLIKAMWEDNDLKSKKLEGALPAARRKEIQGLSKQFYAAMIGYDEGILGDDHILAGALWRRFLRLDLDHHTLLTEDFDNPEKHDVIAAKVKALEMLVIYVRSQFLMLNGLSREQLLRKRAFKFVPFDESLYELAAKMEKSQISGESVKMR